MDITFTPDFAVDDASCKKATGKDLRMTWLSPGFDPTEIEVQLVRAGDKTTVNVYHKRIQTRAEADGLRRAWGEALDRLKTKLTA